MPFRSSRSYTRFIGTNVALTREVSVSLLHANHTRGFPKPCVQHGRLNDSQAVGQCCNETLLTGAKLGPSAIDLLSAPFHPAFLAPPQHCTPK